MKTSAAVAWDFSHTCEGKYVAAVYEDAHKIFWN